MKQSLQDNEMKILRNSDDNAPLLESCSYSDVSVAQAKSGDFFCRSSKVFSLVTAWAMMHYVFSFKIKVFTSILP